MISGDTPKLRNGRGDKLTDPERTASVKMAEQYHIEVMLGMIGRVKKNEYN